jgi:hypothetical protein
MHLVGQIRHRKDEGNIAENGSDTRDRMKQSNGARLRTESPGNRPLFATKTESPGYGWEDDDPVPFECILHRIDLISRHEHLNRDSYLVQSPQDVKRVIVESRERPGCEKQVDNDAIESPILTWHVADTSKGLLHGSAVSIAA